MYKFGSSQFRSGRRKFTRLRHTKALGVTYGVRVGNVTIGHPFFVKSALELQNITFQLELRGPA